MRKSGYRPLPIPLHAGPYLKFVWAELNNQRMSITELSAISGIGRGTIYNWRARHTIRVHHLLAIMNALGYDLTPTPMEEPPQ